MEYYKTNRLWLVEAGIHKEVSFQQEVNGVKRLCYRPSNNFILGVVSVLEPRLAEILPYWLKLSDREALVSILGLDFDPDEWLLEQLLETL
ncbi:MAG: DUF5331 domain-containing protein, partial [Cyanobacteriota bacterium]|nr:DUF5331 domain-containing protein [Cyanobacteriota bacterium]